MTGVYDDRHALYVGWVLGMGMRHGVPLSPIINDDGDYTSSLILKINDRVSITLVVPRPPADWTMTADDE
jgi:hypothetical protein